MMHVMQPLVLDTGWSTTHSSTAGGLSSVPSSYATANAGVTVMSRPVVPAGLSCSSAVTGVESQDTSTTAFSTLNVSSDQLLSAAGTRVSSQSTTNPPKPPKKPLTPYMRFSKAVRY